jgi:hypothetical protein
MNNEEQGIEVVASISADGTSTYLTPVKSQGQFNIQTDSTLIAKGSHFFCQGHLGAVVIEEQSRDETYCSECYRAIKEGSSA